VSANDAGSMTIKPAGRPRPACVLAVGLLMAALRGRHLACRARRAHAGEPGGQR
jgi:hypothetical protein